MSKSDNEPITLELDEIMGPTLEDAASPIGINKSIPIANRFREMISISAFRDGKPVRDIVLFNFTALHEKSGTRFKLAFWDRGTSDVRTHRYRLKAEVKFEPNS